MFVTNKVAKQQQVRKLRALLTFPDWQEKDFNADKYALERTMHLFV